MLQASETVKVYIDILTNLRAEMQDETAKNDTDYLRSKMEELRTHYFSDQVKQMNILSQHLKQLEAIKVRSQTLQFLVFQTQAMGSVPLRGADAGMLKSIVHSDLPILQKSHVHLILNELNMWLIV